MEGKGNIQAIKSRKCDIMMTEENLGILIRKRVELGLKQPVKAVLQVISHEGIQLLRPQKEGISPGMSEGENQEVETVD